MLSIPLVLAVSGAYLLLLFMVARHAERRARIGRSLIDSPWVYTLSIGVYCTAWTYFGSVGRAASSGLAFLPIYLGPTLAMVLAWLVVRRMIRLSRQYRITSIADLVASRYGKSRLLGGLVTLITVVGIVPYIALQLKAVGSAFALLTATPLTPSTGLDGSLVLALVLAAFTIVFGARHVDASERREGMVAAIAFESVVKLLAFLAVGVFVTWGLFAGPADLFGQALAVPELAALLSLRPDGEHARGTDALQWATLTLLAMLSLLLLPRQFQVMVVENVDERHLRRASWAFPLYLLLINLFVLPIALGGLLHFGPGAADPETFVLALPLSQGEEMLALLVFLGGLSAATGMVVVETIAVSTMVSHDLVLPWLLRRTRQDDLGRVLLRVRRVTIVVVLLMGHAYHHLAGEGQALVNIGLISFAAVAQFAPAVLGGLYWRGGTRLGALAGLVLGFVTWFWTLMLPSIARSGGLEDRFLHEGPAGLALLRPEALLGLQGLDPLTHSLFWSLLLNATAYGVLSLWRGPSARETSQALLFVTPPQREMPVFWRGRVSRQALRQLLARFVGADRADALFAAQARVLAAQAGAASPGEIDARWVQFVETQLAGAIGSASARAMVAGVVEEEPLDHDDVRRLQQEALQLRQANEQLRSLDRLKDDFMSSVTHELRTPLTSIRALSEMMRDDPDMAVADRQRFLGIVVAETERLSRLVGQVLDLARIESGHAQWHATEVDLRGLIEQAAQATAELFRERGARLTLELPAQVRPLRTDADRLMQVLMNLLGNAVKFVPSPGGQVRLSLLVDAAGVTVRVQDNGPGVPREQRELIFERFRQGDQAGGRPQGTGLGLPISRQIIERLGGRLWLEPDAGQGACFAFTLAWAADPGPKRQAQEQGTRPRRQT